MSQPTPASRVADDREAGTYCPHCNFRVVYGDVIVACPDCGAVHHARCWKTRGGCGTYDCAPPRRVAEPNQEPSLKITADDLQSAVPLPRARPATASFSVPLHEPAKLGRSRLAAVSLAVAIAGILLFGVITGLVAIVLGALALGNIHHTRQRGSGLAVGGILLGVADVVGWVLFLAAVLSGPGPTLTVADFEPDLAALENLAPHINRAMRANVLVETKRGWSVLHGAGIGSGVIVHIRDGNALVVTNRHVIDPSFADDGGNRAGELPELGSPIIKLIGQLPMPGTVVWIAPDGIDLAVVQVPVYTGEAQAAAWRPDAQLRLGERVFSIGNPQNLGWTHTGGSISQLRFQHRGDRRVSIIQTDTAINPGNSGGGLYDKDGMLIGINTWTNDKRFSEGLSFAIAFHSLLELDPPFLEPAAAGAERKEEPEEPEQPLNKSS